MYVIVMFNILYTASPGTPNMVLVNRKILLIFMEDIWGGGIQIYHIKDYFRKKMMSHVNLFYVYKWLNSLYCTSLFKKINIYTST